MDAETGQEDQRRAAKEKAEQDAKAKLKLMADADQDKLGKDLVTEMRLRGSSKRKQCHCHIVRVIFLSTNELVQ